MCREKHASKSAIHKLNQELLEGSELGIDVIKRKKITIFPNFHHVSVLLLRSKN